jgi:hypothetical protein
VATSEEARLGEAFAELSPRLRAALTPLGDADPVDDAVADAFEYLCNHPDRVRCHPLRRVETVAVGCPALPRTLRTS